MHKRLPPNRLQGIRLLAVVDVAIHRLAEDLGFSPRERLVLRYVALGYPYQEIAAEIGITARTVKMHVANVRQKVGAGTRADLLKLVFAAA